MKYKFFDHVLPKEAIDIRYRVFTLEQGFAAEVDLDEKDNESIHILVYENDKPIATARMFLEKEGVYHIGRLAVLKDYRHKGIGSFVINAFAKKAKELGAIELVSGSQIDKAGFYEANGFSKYGDIFDDANYPHIMMKKSI